MPSTTRSTLETTILSTGVSHRTVLAASGLPHQSSATKSNSHRNPYRDYQRYIFAFSTTDSISFERSATPSAFDHLFVLDVSASSLQALPPGVNSLTQIFHISADRSDVSDISQLQVFSSLGFLSFSSTPLRLQNVLCLHNTQMISLDIDDTPAWEEIKMLAGQRIQHHCQRLQARAQYLASSKEIAVHFMTEINMEHQESGPIDISLRQLDVLACALSLFPGSWCINGFFIPVMARTSLFSRPAAHTAYEYDENGNETNRIASFEPEFNVQPCFVPYSNDDPLFGSPAVFERADFERKCPPAAFIESTDQCLRTSRYDALKLAAELIGVSSNIIPNLEPQNAGRADLRDTIMSRAADAERLRFVWDFWIHAQKVCIDQSLEMPAAWPIPTRAQGWQRCTEIISTLSRSKRLDAIPRFLLITISSILLQWPDVVIFPMLLQTMVELILPNNSVKSKNFLQQQADFCKPAAEVLASAPLYVLTALVSYVAHEYGSNISAITQYAKNEAQQITRSTEITSLSPLEVNLESTLSSTAPRQFPQVFSELCTAAYQDCMAFIATFGTEIDSPASLDLVMQMIEDPSSGDFDVALPRHIYLLLISSHSILRAANSSFVQWPYGDEARYALGLAARIVNQYEARVYLSLANLIGGRMGQPLVTRRTPQGVEVLVPNEIYTKTTWGLFTHHWPLIYELTALPILDESPLSMRPPQEHVLMARAFFRVASPTHHTLSSLWPLFLTYLNRGYIQTRAPPSQASQTHVDITTLRASLNREVTQLEETRQQSDDEYSSYSDPMQSARNTNNITAYTLPSLSGSELVEFINDCSASGIKDSRYYSIRGRISRDNARSTTKSRLQIRDFTPAGSLVPVDGSLLSSSRWSVAEQIAKQGYINPPPPGRGRMLTTLKRPSTAPEAPRLRVEVGQQSPQRVNQRITGYDLRRLSDLATQQSSGWA